MLRAIEKTAQSIENVMCNEMKSKNDSGSREYRSAFL